MTLSPVARDILSQMYILPLVGGGELILLQTFPEGLTESKSVNWQPTEIIGRSHEIRGYSSSGARQISFNTLYVRTDESYGGAVWDTAGIKKYYKLWLSLAYPVYNLGVSPPPTVLLSLGSIQMRAVTDNISIAAHDSAGWNLDDGEAFPNAFTVNASFVEIYPVPISSSEVADRGWF